MKLDRWDHDFRIPARQKISATSLTVEPDMSSAFALAAAAAVGGSTTLLDFPVESLQPDSIFPNILQKMGVPIQFDCGRLKVQRAQFLRGVAVRLTNAPDLFPVLAALCALAEGDSELYGAPQLVHKESDRIARTAVLLRVTGRTLTPLEDGLRVGGVLQKTPSDAARCALPICTRPTIPRGRATTRDCRIQSDHKRRARSGTPANVASVGSDTCPGRLPSRPP
jgi:5-enolpyruvylshikimate-3-phosphate synthase